MAGNGPPVVVYGPCPFCGRPVTNRHHTFRDPWVVGAQVAHLRCKVREEFIRQNPHAKIPRSLEPPGPGET